MYETLEVMIATIDENGIPHAIIKRVDNNTYCSILRKHPSASAYKIGEKLKIPREITKNWHFYNESTYRNEYAKMQAVENKRKTEIRQIFNNNNIQYFYHFTDRRNIEYIKQYKGLFSWKYSRENRMTIPIYGGSDLSRQLDIRYNLQDYVRLSFCKEHPMKYISLNEGRIQDAVILYISIEVAFLERTVFSNMNATDNMHMIGNTADFLENNMDFYAIQQNYFNLDEKRRKYYQAEIMVKTCVPIKYILNIDEL